MTKNQIIAEHVVVTFFEAIIAYVVINQTNLSGSPKAVAIGALGFGLSAVYNILRQSAPTLLVDPSPAEVVIPPETPPAPVVVTPTPEQGSGVEL